ncbi:hypothetical protein B4N89_06030 [Embleya scabrispora]|uniref:Uncharacterized protein n=1 Tax=Embleya scabrispora TaxID=159449 RepID=A0A1T3NV62_9ACTN|nr:hypothetical protein [Embleya scabrispora]OPC80571.1 hypothetical protein B4N89_06030 [Embleya scabrispora]
MNRAPRVLGRDEIDELIVRHEGEYDGITAGLMELESHPGRQLLEGGTLTGRTAERWEVGRRAIALLWGHREAYGAVLDRARTLRGRRGKPQRPELEELSFLLLGQSAELAARDVPIGQRGLLDPALRVHRMSLSELVADMAPAWSEATAVVEAADAVWTRLVPTLDRVDAGIAAAEAGIAELGGPDAVPEQTAALDGVRRRLETARTLVASDPLALTAADDRRIGGVDVAALDAELRRVADEVRHLTIVRARFEERIRRLAGLLDELDYQEGDTIRRRAHVLTRISDKRVPEVPLRAATLRERMAGVLGLGTRGDWVRVSRELSALENDAQGARDRLAATRGHIDAPLARRDELRGLVQSYRAMAARAGHGEEAVLESLYDHAKELLWRAPCELDVAVRVVTRYQEAVIAAQRKDRPDDKGDQR